MAATDRLSETGLMFVVHSLNPGGTERLALDLAVHLSKNWNVVVACLDEPGLWVEDLRSLGIPVYSIWRQPGFDVNASKRIAALAGLHNISIVHAFQYTPWVYAAVSRLFRSESRVIFHEHGRFYPEEHNPKRIAFNRLIPVRLTSRCMAVSNDVRNRLVRYEGLPDKLITVVHNGTGEPEKLTPSRRRLLRQQLGFNDSHFVVGAIGRLDPIKNIPMILNAIATLQPSVPEIRGLIVGDGPESHQLRSLANRVGISDLVLFTGHRDDAKELVQCMDVFVLASFSEGISVALLEAMATSVAVVATCVGGTPEVVTSGVNGVLVESNNESELKTALLELHRKPTCRTQIAQAGQGRFRSEFSFEKMVREIEANYSECVSNA